MTPPSFTVLVTRAETPQQNLRQLLEAEGATVLEMPTLLITPPSSWDPLDAALSHLPDYDWLLLTSGNAVTFFMQRFHSQQRDPQWLRDVSIAVVGEKTAQVLAQFGLTPKVIPKEFVAEALLPHLAGARQILFPRVESGGGTELTQALRHQGSRVDEVPAYESRCPPHGDPQVWEALAAGRVDVMTFASSKTVEHCVQLAKQDGIPLQVVARPKLAVIGPKTAATCERLLGRVDIQAQPYTLEGLVQAIVRDRFGG
ncbi:MAG: uroporphyrinogen-III synthase [Thermostichales cyanobacterium BF4_bins_65]